MKKGTITLFILVITVISGLLQLYITHKLSTAGIQLTQMENEIKALSLENEELRHKIASSSSLMTIASRAQELGFNDATFYAIEKPPIALVQ